MRKFIIIFYTVFFCSGLVSAQNIKGLVFDKEHNPIEFANVILMRDSTFIKGCITDSNGKFIFSDTSAVNNHVVITMVGYEHYIAPVPANGNLGSIILVESAVLLNEVTIKANLPKTRLKGGILVTNVENSVLSKMGTANDVLSHLPLVSGQEDNYTVFGKGTPLIYINGRQVKNTNELRQLSSENIKSVDVITNPGAQYSSDAQAVIRINTKLPQGEGLSVNLYNALRVSHYVRNNPEVLLSYYRKGLEIFANADVYIGKKQYIDQSEMITSGNNMLHQYIDSRAVSKFNEMYGKLGFSYLLSSSHSFGAYYKFGREHNDINANVISNIDLFEQSTLTSSDTIITNWLSKTTSLPTQEANVYYNGKVGELGIDFNADFLQTRTERKNNQIEINIDQSSDNRHILSQNLNKSQLMAEKLILTHPLWKGKINIGEEYSNSRLFYENYYKGAPVNNAHTDIEENNIATFVVLSQKFGAVNASFELRYEHVDYKYFEDDVLQTDLSKTYNNIFPSLSLNSKIDNVDISLSFANKTKRPSYSQLDGGIQYINRFTYQCGNPQLKPTQIYNMQLMSMWKWYFLQMAVNHEVNSIFWKTSFYDNDSSVKLMSFENVPHNTLLQVTVGAQPTIGCWKPQATIGVLKQFYSTTYLGKELLLDDPMLLFSLNNTISLPKNWMLGVDCQFMTAGYSQNMVTRPTNKINLMLRKSLFDSNLVITLYVKDLLNQSTNWATMFSGDMATKFYNQAEQRNVRLTLRYTFNSSRSKYRGTGSGKSEKARM